MIIWMIDFKMVKEELLSEEKYGSLTGDDALEKFWNNSSKNYGLWTGHYLLGPTLIWDAMLNMTKVDLELISNDDMYLFFKKIWKTEFLTFLRNIVNI